MTLNIQTTRVALNNTTGTQDITISGFGSTPVAAIIATTISKVTDERRDHSHHSIGFCDATRQYCTGITSEDGRDMTVTTNQSRRAHSSTDVLLIYTEGSTTFNVEAKFDSFISNGIKIDITNADASIDYYVMVTLFGGSDIANVRADFFDDLGTGTSAIPVTAPGFQADLVFSLGSAQGVTPAEPPNIASHAQYGFGVWSRDDATQMALGFGDLSGVDPSRANTYLSTAAGCNIVVDDALVYELTFSAHASGFNVTPSADATTDILGYLAIEWATTPSVEIVEVTLPASATDYAETGFSFQPEFGMLVMSNHTVADAVHNASDAAVFSVSMIESGQIITAGIASENNEGTTSQHGNWLDNTFLLLDSNGASVLSEGTLQSLDSNGWTIDLGGGSHDSVARKGFALAVKAADGGGVTLTDVIAVTDGSPIV
jgi:hypothetical protein